MSLKSVLVVLILADYRDVLAVTEVKLVFEWTAELAGLAETVDPEPVVELAVLAGFVEPAGSALAG